VNSIEWVYSNGGPLVVAPAEIASSWRGIEGGSDGEDGPGESASDDYARACTVRDYLGTLPVGSGTVLILGGDEPYPTGFVATPEGGILVRWAWANSIEDAQRAFDNLPDPIWEPTPYQIEVAQGGILLFDSTFPGDKISALGRNRTCAFGFKSRCHQRLTRSTRPNMTMTRTRG
jgi:hypothetical protein